MRVDYRESLFLFYKKLEKILIFSTKSKDIYEGTFKILLVFHVLFSLLGLNHRITDCHSYRQTQTAITAYYFLKDGFTINYITPIIGYPWTIPFEMPIYQWTVALLTKCTGLNLDVSGRIVSIISFYISLNIVMRFRKILPSFPSYLAGSFILSCPIYIFWSRTFLIESMVLMFTLLFVYTCLSYLKYGKTSSLLSLILFGLAASLLKITTFLVGAGLITLLVSFASKEMNLSIRKHMRQIVIVAFALVIVLIIQNVWIKHCDEIKSGGYMSSVLTSTTLKKWNFGTMEQRLDPYFYREIIVNSSLAVPLAILFSFLSLFLKNNSRIPYLFLISGFSGWLVFFNLYKAHNYYHYASNIYLMIAIAYFINSIQNNKLRVQSTIFVLMVGYGFYFYKYFHRHVKNSQDGNEIAQLIKKNSKSDDVVIIIGDNWSSEIPYYSERKSVCLETPNLDELKKDPGLFIKKLNTANIKHLVLVKKMNADRESDYCKSLRSLLSLNKITETTDRKAIIFSRE